MELQFHKEALNCLGKALREVKNAELTQELRLSDGMPDIGRVLGSWAQVILRSKEWRSDAIGLSGGVMVWVLYVPEDGTEPRCAESWIPFQMMWDLKEMVPEGSIRCLPLLRFVDSRSVSARKMMIRAGLAVMGEAMYPMEAAVFQPGEMPEDVEILQRSYPLRLPKEAGERTFALDEDLLIPESIPAVDKILGYFLRPEITDKKVMANKLVFKGSGNLHLLYRCSEGKIRTQDFELPFSQYADLQGEYGSDAQGDIQMGVTNLELDMQQPGQLRIKCGMLAQYLVDDREVLELTEDAYSPVRDVELITDELRLPVILENRTEMVAAEQSIPGLTGEMAELTIYPDFPRQRYSENTVQLEMPALFQGIVYGEDGSPQGVNSRWEGSMNIPADSSVQMDFAAQPKGNVQTVPAVDGTGVAGQIQLQMLTFADQGLRMVTGMSLGDAEEPDAARPSLILCRTHGESLWDVAKRCGSTVSAIRTANGVDGEPGGEQMLLIPVC